MKENIQDIELQPITTETSVTEAEKTKGRLQYVSLKKIQDTKIEKTDAIVEGILPHAVTLLSSRPKAGKSWLALDLAICIAKGENFWDKKTAHGPCLYLALEDDSARIQNRANTLLDDEDAPENLYVAGHATSISDGLIDDLNYFMDEHPDAVLIIIDVLQLIRGDGKNGQSEYGYDYKELGKLKEFSIKRNVSILALTHTRKTAAKDPFDLISGGRGITGSVDTLLMIDTSNEKQTMLRVQGRDIQSQNYIIKFDAATCKWNCLGSDVDALEEILQQQYQSSEVVKFIKELVVTNNGQWSGTCSDMLKLATEMYGHPIAKSESALSRKINNLEDRLFTNDHIAHVRPDVNGGAKGRVHSFVIEEPDVIESVEASDFAVIGK